MRKLIEIELAVFLLLVIVAMVGVKVGFVKFNSGEGKRYVTVVGTAKKKETNKIASFSAGVTIYNKSKDKAVDEVNSKMNALIEGLKKFGISSDDIKTEAVNTYQQRQYENGKEKLGDWTATNSISIVLREVKKASELTDLLNKSGANNIFGPNFSVEAKEGENNDLYKDAIADAKVKATIMVEAGGGKLGKVLRIEDSASPSQVYPLMKDSVGYGGGVSASLEPGTSETSKSLVVSFEIE